MLMLPACERAGTQANQTDLSDAGWVRVDLESLSAAQATQREQAITARDQLAQTLKGELVSAITSEGPVHAIDVCHTRAPEIAAEVALSNGVQIGRTSHRMRNAENTAPDWMQPVVDEQDPTPHAFADGEGTLAFAYPIILEGACIVCHGSNEQVPAPVREAIDQRYPDDRATGFAPGDLRGWFWVQVPPEN